MRLDAFLKFNEEEILEDKGKVKMEVAKAFAESEYEKYRVIQDKIYKSDFDKLYISNWQVNRRGEPAPEN